MLSALGISSSAVLAGPSTLGTQKKSKKPVSNSLFTCYNTLMKINNFNLAMDASDGIFAYYLCGVLTSCHESGSTCPDPEAEALSYLQTFYPEALEKAEADELNLTSELELS